MSGLLSRFRALLAPRMQLWLLISVVLFVAILVLAPRQLPVALYKIALVTSAAWVGYWIDRSLFPYGRPNAFLKPCGFPQAHLPISREQAIAFAAAMLRRAWIIGCAMIAVASGA